MWEYAIWAWAITNQGLPLAQHEVPFGQPWLETTSYEAMFEPSLPFAQAPTTATQKISDVLHTPSYEPPGPETKLCSINLAVPTAVTKILHELSVQSGVNLILLAKTDTTLTLRLTNVKLLDMIRHICAMADLTYLRVGEAYVIATPEKLEKAYPKEWLKANPKAEPDVVVPPKAPEIVTETYMVNYVDGKQISEALGSFFKEKGLIVVAGPVQVSPTVSGKETASATGIATGVLDKEKTETGKMLVLRGSREVVDDAIAMAKTMDYARQQVAIYVSIHDITNEAARELGLSWTFSNLSISENPNGINFGSFTRAPLSFLATIKALEKQDRSKLLASPNISVLDGERAFILIGNRLNFPVLVGYSQANTPIFDKQEERVGIYLQVAAAIGSDGQITLSLYPQVSSVTGFLEVNGASYPQISTREAQTTLRVNTGETIVMGGMLKDEEIQSIEKVPLLSELPFFGELFKRRKRTKVSSQVMISITPVLMTASK